MSKALDNGIQLIKRGKNVASKFSASAREGSRIVPSMTNDATCQVRVDAGYFDPATKKLNVVLQVNSQATSPGLLGWLKKNTSHGKLATAVFDTGAADKAAEAERVLNELNQKGKENLK